MPTSFKNRELYWFQRATVASTVEEFGRAAEVEWVRRHISVCAPALGLPAKAEIRYVPLVVVDRELLSSHLVSDPVKAVALRRLRDAL